MSNTKSKIEEGRRVKNRIEKSSGFVDLSTCNIIFPIGKRRDRDDLLSSDPLPTDTPKWLRHMMSNHSYLHSFNEGKRKELFPDEFYKKREKKRKKIVKNNKPKKDNWLISFIKKLIGE